MAYSHTAYIHLGRKHKPKANSVMGAHLPPSLLIKRKGDSRPNCRSSGTELNVRGPGLSEEEAGMA